MQFAGQRTDMDLNVVGDPVNILVKLSDDILPDPGAIMVTGITPQQTIQDGVTEAEFLQMFHEQVATPDTIFVGFNTVRFDDEFLRFLHYRNFYDAYEWAYKDGKSRWDILDMVRMTRALRPEGINWPMIDGKPSCRLELLTKENGLDHEHAHDALNDVLASIAFAKLIKEKQPKLFDWLLQLRDKKDVKRFIEANPTFIYSSGKYDTGCEKTAVARLLHVDDSKGALVYNLAVDPTEFLDLPPEELADRWRYPKEEPAPPRLPVKTLKFNRCPALSPTGILSDAGVQKRLQVTPEQVQHHLSILSAHPEFIENIVKARDLLDDERGEHWSREAPDADAALYDGGFFDDNDKRLMYAVRTAVPSELSAYAGQFHDARLNELLVRYKARNYRADLTDEERTAWEEYRYHSLLDGGGMSRLGKFMNELADLAKQHAGTDKMFLLEELQLYAESIVPVVDTESDEV
jgi:exodeoxyribonuclease-1